MSEENTTVMVCQKHGIHNEAFVLPLGAEPDVQPHVFCKVCVIERLDGLGVNRMYPQELTPEQVAELERAYKAQNEAAE